MPESDAADERIEAAFRDILKPLPDWVRTEILKGLQSTAKALWCAKMSAALEGKQGTIGDNLTESQLSAFLDEAIAETIPALKAGFRAPH